MTKSLSRCPSCGGQLKISQYHCSECEIDINGEFEGCIFCNLNDEDRYFALVFLQTGGNIKDVERVMGISYPTVKAKLATLLRNLGVGNGGEAGSPPVDKAAIKAEIKEMKKHLKEKIKGNLHRTLHHKLHGHNKHPGRFSFHLNGDKTEPDSNPDAKEVIDELKAGNIDVAAALRRLRGEKEEKVEDVKEDENHGTD